MHVPRIGGGFYPATATSAGGFRVENARRIENSTRSFARRRGSLRGIACAGKRFVDDGACFLVLVDNARQRMDGGLGDGGGSTASKGFCGSRFGCGRVRSRGDTSSQHLEPRQGRSPIPAWISPFFKCVFKDRRLGLAYCALNQICFRHAVDSRGQKNAKLK